MDSSQLPGTPTLLVGMYTVGPWASCPPRVSLGHNGSHPGQATGQREACSLSGLGHQPLFGQLPFAERPLPLMSFGGRATDTPVWGLFVLCAADQGFGGRMCRNKDVSWGNLLCWRFCLLLQAVRMSFRYKQSARIRHQSMCHPSEKPQTVPVSPPCQHPTTLREDYVLELLNLRVLFPP